MLGGPKLRSGSTSGGSVSVTSTDDEDNNTSSTSSWNGGTIDLGRSPAGGGSQNFDFENNDAAVVDTGNDISDAGGPEGVLAGNRDQAKQVKDAVSEVTGQLRDQQQTSEPEVVDNTDQNTVTTTDTPDPSTPDLPTFGGNGGPSGKALLVGAVALVLALIGGL